MSKKMIIFDCFGVLVCEVAPQWLRMYFDDKEADRIKDEIIAKADKNEISDKELFEIIGNLSGVGADRVLKEWIEISQRKNDVINFVIELRNKYTTALLSNAPKGLVQTLLGENLLDEMFDIKVISNQIGMAKPDLNIYEYILEKSGRKGEDCIFTDDNGCNLIPAEKLGIKTILFRDLDSFKAELVKYDIEL